MSTKKKNDDEAGRVEAGEGQMSAKKGEGPDRSPSEVFDGPAHALNLGLNQRVSVNDQKKRELEAAFPGRYEFLKIEHHGTLSPVEGDHEFAWEARNAGEAERQEEAFEGKTDSASDDQHLNPDQEPEGLKS